PVSALFVMALITLLQQRGLRFISALRAFRVWIVTKKRPNYRPSDMTRMVDFGFEPLPERFLNEKPVDKNAPPPAPKKNSGESVGKDANKATVPPAKKSQ
ncbi:MAG: hypothetical protein K2Q32_03430, partial [Alphaproteobacteria bacterium]|nr:hypothetical protein [Alphaproteobacteria bacterium]